MVENNDKLKQSPTFTSTEKTQWSHFIMQRTFSCENLGALAQAPHCEATVCPAPTLPWPQRSWPAPLLCRTLLSPGQQSSLPCSTWTHRKAKACLDPSESKSVSAKSCAATNTPNEFFPWLLDGGVTHRLEATDL